MHFRLFNTESGNKEELVTQQPGVVRIYSCGPTVYNYAHIGNFRSYVFVDILRKSLQYLGFKVEHAMNITDVDDKTIAGAQHQKVTLKEFTERFTDEFFDDLEKLSIARVEHNPRATACIDAMLDMIARLKEGGYTYEQEGSTYFSIAKYNNYGRLSKVELDQVKAGARYDADEYTKDDVRDFVLWKAPKDESEDRWDSPFGPGRPGWHLECAAMIRQLFGAQGVDIHTGGIDLVFPHHENEMAECCAAHPNDNFVRYWMHNEHLLVENKKMSKSLGNFYTLRDLEHMGHEPRAVRYVLLSGHYRSKLNFTFESLDAAAKTLQRLDQFITRLLPAGHMDYFSSPEEWPAEFQGEFEILVQSLGGLSSKQEPSVFLHPELLELEREFRDALSDDLNISKALAVLFEAVKQGNHLLEQPQTDPIIARQYVYLLFLWNRVFSFLNFAAKTGDLPDDDIDRLVHEREAARIGKDYTRADEIRDQLKAAGIVLEDTPQGVRWSRL